MIHIVGKSTPRFTKSPSLVFIGLVLTEIKAFNKVKNLQMRTNTDSYLVLHGMKSGSGSSPGVDGGWAVAKSESPKINFLHSERCPKICCKAAMEKQN